jgi:uncharacterized SAM-binding protein YcdF (DUF218 family)
LSWRGWLLFLAIAIGMATLFLFRIYPFLAISQRMDTDILVVEGWVPFYAIRFAVAEFGRGHYERIFTTGGPLVGSGRYVNDHQTAASGGAKRLKAAGIPSEVIQMVPSRVMTRDRTYGSAIALAKWLREHNVPIRSINVLTENLHARRTRLLFQKALGDEIAVGIIAVPHPDYDSRYWWRYSEGVREVITELAAYVYAKLFFWPPAAA